MNSSARARALRHAVACAGLALLAAGCAVGEGEGAVTSDRLFMNGCWDGKFDLQPDFFAANPTQSNSLILRVQRGANSEEQSDGLLVIINDLDRIRSMVGQELKVGLPPGVSPPGVPVTLDPDPALINLALYLHATCNALTATVYSLSGSITFHSLFSGDLNEGSAERRLTDAEFTATFGDPRRVSPLATDEQKVTSQVSGHFRFYFQRGQPAQPFQ